MTKPRILIIENSIAATGALESIIRSCQGLNTVFTFIFVVPEKSAVIPYVMRAGFEVHELPMKELRKSFSAFATYLPVLFSNTLKLSKLIAKNKIDLIVVNDFYNLLPTALRLLGRKQPYICYVRFLPSKFPKALVKLWCSLHSRYAFTTVAVSQAVKKELPQSNVIVIPNELPSEGADFISPLDSTTILYPANYIQGKGHEFALESFAQICKDHPGWKLKFVGGDMGLRKNRTFKQNLQRLAVRLKIDDQVEWHGFASKMSEEYLNAGMVLNFSESESFSLTCLEAMFYGRPVIATRSGGPAEIIDQNETGILVNLKDTTAMAQAIDYLVKHPEEREAMAIRAYDRVREKFSFENTTGKLSQMYKSALKDY